MVALAQELKFSVSSLENKKREAIKLFGIMMYRYAHKQDEEDTEQCGLCLRFLMPWAFFYMVVLCILHDGCSIAGTLFYPFCMFGIDYLDDCCGNVIWLLDNVYGFVVSH